jgi:HlyD family secretion protein
MKLVTSTLRFSRKILVVGLAVALLGGAGWGLWTWRQGGNGKGGFRTEKVTRGRLVATISASGTLVPEEVVDVGAQVVGQIVEFGHDLDDSRKVIDYGSRVKEGTILAKIDDALYAPDVAIAEADLAVSDAEVKRSQADLDSARAKLMQTTKDWERARKLGPTSTISGLDYDTIQNAYLTSKAAVPAAVAVLEKAKKTVDRSVKVLEKAKKTLGYCTIKSPVNGVIIDRRVNIGQTVVSNLNAPSLFLIAKDLKRMKVWASVNEADIALIKAGQTVYFKVDAYPTEVFTGVVEQIRLNATMTQNVVTYTVLVGMDNEHLKLKPYQTANMQFQVSERTDALLVPNAALRFRPADERIHPDYRTAMEQNRRRKSITQVMSPKDNKKKQNRAVVWVEDGEFVRPIKVRTGLTDGASTEIVEVLEGQLDATTELVTGELQTKSGGGINPFAPKLFGGAKKQ